MFCGIRILGKQTFLLSYPPSQWKNTFTEVWNPSSRGNSFLSSRGRSGSNVICLSLSLHPRKRWRMAVLMRWREREEGKTAAGHCPEVERGRWKKATSWVEEVWDSLSKQNTHENQAVPLSLSRLWYVCVCGSGSVWMCLCVCWCVCKCLHGCPCVYMCECVWRKVHSEDTRNQEAWLRVLASSPSAKLLLFSRLSFPHSQKEEDSIKFGDHKPNFSSGRFIYKCKLALETKI